MSKNFWRVAGALVCLIAVLMLGCEEDEKTVTLLIATNTPPPSAPALTVDFWAAEMAKQSGGKLEFEIYHSEELLGEREMFKGTQTGATDIGYYVLDEIDGFVLNTVMSLPFMGWPGQEETSLLYEDLLAQFPELRAEWDDLTILSLVMMSGTHMHFKDVVVDQPSDLAGVKVMGAESMATDAVQAAGATAVDVPVFEMASALDNGTIDAVINHFPALKVFGGVEKVNYHLTFGEGGINMTPVCLIISNDVLNNLDKELRDLLVNSNTLWRDKFLELDDVDEASSRQIALDAGHTFNNLTAEQIDEWRVEIAQSLHDEWIAATEADGLPGQEVYDELLNKLQ